MFIRIATIICISIGMIFLGGALFYKHSSSSMKNKNPILWAMSIALASGGGCILMELFIKNMFLYDIKQDIFYFENIK